MKSIGFRYWGDRFFYVVLEGTQTTLIIIIYQELKPASGK